LGIEEAIGAPGNDAKGNRLTAKRSTNGAGGPFAPLSGDCR